MDAVEIASALKAIAIDLHTEIDPEIQRFHETHGQWPVLYVNNDIALVFFGSEGVSRDRSDEQLYVFSESVWLWTLVDEIESWQLRAE